MAYIHFISAVCLLCYVSFTTALTVGTCTLEPSDTKTKAYFNMNRMEGTWYLYGSHSTVPPAKGRLPCTTYQFSQPIIGVITLKVTETIKTNEFSTRSNLSPESNAIFSTEPGHSESAESSQESNESKGIFVVVDTDYDCWAITYWCEQEKPSDKESVKTIAVFLRNKSDRCLKAKSKKSYENLMAGFTSIESNNLKWQDMNRCKVEGGEKTLETSVQKDAKQPENKQPEHQQNKEDKTKAEPKPEQKTETEAKHEKSKKKH